MKHIHAEFALPGWTALFVSETKGSDIRFQYNLAGGILMDAG